MMRGELFALAGLGLSGCLGGAQVPDDDKAFVEVYSGNGQFSGFVRKTVYADDMVLVASSGEGGRDQRERVFQGPPGLDDRVVALVATEGPKVRVTAPGPENMCLDYGQDRVTMRPSVGGFTSVSASCPEPAMIAFATRVSDAIVLP